MHSCERKTSPHFSLKLSVLMLNLLLQTTPPATPVVRALTTDWWYLIPVGLVIVMVVLEALSHRVGFLVIFFQVARYLFSVGALVGNILFVWYIYSFSLPIFSVSVVVLGFSIFSSALFVIIVRKLDRKNRKDTMDAEELDLGGNTSEKANAPGWTATVKKALKVGFIVAFQAIDLGLLVPAGFEKKARWLGRSKPNDLEKKVGSPRMAGAWFQHAPFFLLQVLSLWTVAPAITLVTIAFNCLFLVHEIAHETTRWLRYRSRQAAEHEMAFLDPHQARSDSVSSAAAPDTLFFSGRDNPISEGPPLFYWLLRLTSVLVAVSLIPQLFTIFGIPMVMTCLKRLQLVYRDPYTGSQLAGSTDNSLPWHSSRGMFLVPLNILSMGAVLMVVLPVFTVFSPILWCVNMIYQKSRIDDVALFTRLRESIRLLVESLAFAYLPFLLVPPAETGEDGPKREELGAPNDPKEKKGLGPVSWVTAFLWFIAVEIVVPIVDIITDFQFATQLLIIWKDPALEDPSALLVWVLLSFLSSGAGVFLELAKTVGVVFHFRGAGLNRKTVEDYVIANSPFGNPRDVKIYVRVLKLIGVFAEDIAQILITCFTIGYIGRVNPLWATKLFISIASASASLAKLTTHWVFGYTITKLVRFGLQCAYFGCFGLTFALVAFVTIRDTFCSIDRTLLTVGQVEEIAACATITSSFLLQAFPWAVSTSLQATAVDSKFLVIANNTHPVTFGVAHALSLNTTVVVSGNTGLTDVVFWSLTTLAGSNITVDHNSQLLLDFPSCQHVPAGSNLFITDNTYGGAPLTLGEIGDIAGEVFISRNVAPLASFHLQSVSGIFSVVGNSFQSPSSLSLTELTTLSGEMTLSGNTGLVAVLFGDPSPPVLTGNLTISGNPDLVSLTTGFSDIEGYLEISNNPKLTTLDLSSLITIQGKLVIRDNSMLASISFPGLIISQSQCLVVTDNPNLSAVAVTLNAELLHFYPENNSPTFQVFHTLTSTGF